MLDGSLLYYYFEASLSWVFFNSKIVQFLATSQNLLIVRFQDGDLYFTIRYDVMHVVGIASS